MCYMGSNKKRLWFEATKEQLFVPKSQKQLDSIWSLFDYYINMKSSIQARTSRILISQTHADSSTNKLNSKSASRNPQFVPTSLYGRESPLTVSSYKIPSMSLQAAVLTQKRKRTLGDGPKPILKKESIDIFQLFMKQDQLKVRKIMKSQKIKGMINNFKSKVQRNLVSRPPVEFEPYRKQASTKHFDWQAFNLSKSLTLFLQIATTLHLLAVMFAYTLAFAFGSHVSSSGFFISLEAISIIFYTVEILQNIFVARVEGEIKVSQVEQLLKLYMGPRMAIDLLVLLLTVVDLILGGRFPQMGIVRILIFLKGKEMLQKLQKIESLLVKNFKQGQYLAVTKIFFTNFLVAHILAIILLELALMEPENNWMTNFKIENAQWVEKYVWAYYWAMTTMLTVGYGDITPANYKQAICLTLIQSFSCIILAYNINCIGNLISVIRARVIEKQKSLQTMKRLAEDNDISVGLHSKINNFIQESDKIKKSLMFEADKELLSKLPADIKAEYLKECNKKIFNHLFFFKDLTLKSLQVLAEKLEVKIAHPREIIYDGRSRMYFQILREGRMGYYTNLPDSQHHKTLIDEVRAKKSEGYKLLHLEMLKNNSREVKYFIKAIQCSVLHEIDVQEALEIIKPTKKDFQSYFMLRDRSKHIFDEFEVISCDFCPEKHSKMTCPKLHYSPIPQVIIYRHLFAVKTGRNCRRPNHFYSKFHCQPLKHYKSIFKQISLIACKGRRSRSIKIPDNDSFMIYRKMRCPSSLMDCIPSEQQLSKQIKPDDPVSNNIKSALMEFLREEKVRQTQIGFWDLQVDQIENYNVYFPHHNSLHLKETLLCEREQESISSLACPMEIKVNDIIL